MELKEQLQKLVDGYYGAVRRRFDRMVADPHLAEDLTQQVFLHLCDRLSDAQPVENWRGYIFGIAVNVFRRHLRGQGRSGPAVATAEGLENAAGVDSHPADDIARRETRETLQVMLNKLAAIDQEIVMATQVFGLSAREVGSRLGIPRSKVLYRLTQALEQMRDMARQEGLTL